MRYGSIRIAFLSQCLDSMPNQAKLVVLGRRQELSQPGKPLLGAGGNEC
jgi:hypothetical protein